jgi:hypothetical protein
MYCHYPIEFEVPDEWLAMAGVQAFNPKSSAFLTFPNPECLLVAIAGVEPPIRNEGVDGLQESRAVSILQAMVSSQHLPAIEVHENKLSDLYRFSVYDGYHRYYLSIALGFTMLPVLIRCP